MPSTNGTPGNFIDFNGGAVQLQASPTTTSHTYTMGFGAEPPLRAR
jgi:hypothetical protein